MQIIGICGRIGSGKDVVADYIVSRYGFKKIVMSDLIVQELHAKNLPINRANMRNLAQKFRRKYGMEIWAIKSIEYTKAKKWEKIIICGIRNSFELKIFRQTKNFSLIYVKVSQKTRFARLLKRKSVKETGSLFEQERKEMTTFDLYDKFDKVADYTVSNEGDLESLHQNIDKFIQS